MKDQGKTREEQLEELAELRKVYDELRILESRLNIRVANGFLPS